MLIKKKHLAKRIIATLLTIMLCTPWSGGYPSPIITYAEPDPAASIVSDVPPAALEGAQSGEPINIEETINEAPPATPVPEVIPSEPVLVVPPTTELPPEATNEPDPVEEVFQNGYGVIARGAKLYQKANTSKSNLVGEFAAKATVYAIERIEKEKEDWFYIAFAEQSEDGQLQKVTGYVQDKYMKPLDLDAVARQTSELEKQTVVLYLDQAKSLPLPQAVIQYVQAEAQATSSPEDQIDETVSILPEQTPSSPEEETPATPAPTFETIVTPEPDQDQIDELVTLKPEPEATAEPETTVEPEVEVNETPVPEVQATPDGTESISGEAQPEPEFTGKTILVRYSFGDGEADEIELEAAVSNGAIVLASAFAGQENAAVFMGWADDQGMVYEAGAEYAVADDVETLTFTAVYEQVRTVLVRYQLAESEDAYTDIETPVQDGHIILAQPEEPLEGFIGWLDDQGTVHKAGAEYAVADDMETFTFTAVYEQARTVLVRYQLAESEDIYTDIETPVQDGHIILAQPEEPLEGFIGWLDAEEAVYEAGAEYAVADDMETLTFTAVYEQVRTVLVRYQLAESEDAYTDIETPVQDGHIILAQPEEPLEGFIGWLDAEEAVHEAGAEYAVADDMETLTFTAVYEQARIILVRYRLGEAEDAYTDIETPVQNGYIILAQPEELLPGFIGWMDDQGVIHAAGVELAVEEDLMTLELSAAYSEQPSVTVITEQQDVVLGEALTFIAVPYNMDLQSTHWQWQYSIDGENWEDISGETGLRYTYIVDQENWGYLYRILAAVVDDTVRTQPEDLEAAGESEDAPELFARAALLMGGANVIVVSSNPIIAPLAYSDGVHVNPMNKKLMDEMGIANRIEGSEANTGAYTSPLLRLESGIQKAGGSGKVYLWAYYRPYSDQGLAITGFTGTTLNGMGRDIVRMPEYNHGYLFQINQGETNWVLQNMVLRRNGGDSGDVLGMVGGKLVLNDVLVDGSIHYEVERYAFTNDKEAPLSIENAPVGAVYDLTINKAEAKAAIQRTAKHRLPLVQLEEGKTLGIDVAIELTGDLAAYKLNQIGRIVYLMEDIDYTGVFVSGAGDDTEDGSTPYNPVKTWDRVLQLLTATGYDLVYVVGTPVAVADIQAWDSADVGRPLTIQRYDGSSSLTALAPDYNFAYKTGELIDVQPGGELTLTNITVRGLGNSGTQTSIPRVKASLVRVSGGQLILGDGSLLTLNWTEASSSYMGGAVRVDSGQLHLQQGAKVTQNYAYYGGAVYMEAKTQMTGTDAELSANEAYYGGAVFMGQSAEATLTRVKIEKNSAQQAAAFYMSAGTSAAKTRLLTTASSISENNGKSSYSGIYMSGYCEFVDKESTIKDNTTGSGSLIYASGYAVVVDLYKTRIVDNKITGTSGYNVMQLSGSSVSNRATCTMDQVEIAGNTGGSGVIYVLYTELTIKGEQGAPSVIKNNTAQTYAGIYMYYSSLDTDWADILDNSVTGTSSSSCAGIYVYYFAYFKGININHTTISRNAGSYAGLYVYESNSYTQNVQVQNSVISGNQGKTFAGMRVSVYVTSPQCTITDTDILENKASQDAGLWLAQTYSSTSYSLKVALNGVKINKNEVETPTSGGYAGMYLNKVQLTMSKGASDNEICDNKGIYTIYATASDTGIYNLSIADTKIQRNQASNALGTTLYMDHAKLALIRTAMLDNVNAQAGQKRHIYCGSLSQLTIDGATKIGDAANPHYIYLSDAYYPMRLLSACENGNLYWLNVSNTFQNGDRVVIPCPAGETITGYTGPKLSLVGSELIHFQGVNGDPVPTLPARTLLADAGGDPSTIILIRRGVYVDGTNGLDTQDGFSPQSAVNTFDRAKTVLQQLVATDPACDDFYPYIYVVNAIEPQAAWENWNLSGITVTASDMEPQLMRYGQNVGAMILVKTGKELVTNNLQINGGGIAEMGYGYNSSTGAITGRLVPTSAMVAVSGGTYKAFTGTVLKNNWGSQIQATGAISVKGTGSLIMDGAAVRGNRALSGAGIHFDATGSLLIDNSVIEDNLAFLEGGGLYMRGGASFEIKDTAFLKNRVSDMRTSQLQGGGVYFTGNAKGTVSDCLFDGNEAINTYSGYTAVGGAIASSSTGRIDVKGATRLVNNLASHEGGAIYATAGEVRVYSDQAGKTLTVAGDIYMAPNAQLCMGGDVKMPVVSEKKPMIILRGKPIVMMADFLDMNANPDNTYLLDLNSSFAGEIVVRGNNQATDAGRFDATYSDGLNADQYLENFTLSAASRELLQQDLSGRAPHIVMGIFHVYLKTAGSDSNSGASPDTAVKTFARAAQILKDSPEGANIIICGEVQISADETWALYDPGMQVFTNNQSESWQALIQRYMEYGGYLITVQTGKKLTLDHLVLDGNMDQMIVTAVSSMVKLDGQSTLIIQEGATLQNNEVKSATSTTLYGGAIYANVAQTAIEIHGTVKNNRVTTESTTINSGNAYGGAVYISGANTTLTITGTLENNQINTCFGGYGGAVYVGASNAKVTIDGAAILNNGIYFQQRYSSAFTAMGGALAIAGTGTTLDILPGTMVEGNKINIQGSLCYAYGGAVSISNSVQTGVGTRIEGATFKDNAIHASGSSYSAQGGALYISVSTHSVSIADSSFTQNSCVNAASVAGGALYIYGSGSSQNAWVQMRDTHITGNTAVGSNNSSSYSAYGGGACLLSSGTGTDLNRIVDISGGSFQNNKAEAYVVYGGGLHVRGYSTSARAQASIQDLLIHGNLAQNPNQTSYTQSGGGIYAEACDVTIKNSTLSENKTFGQISTGWFDSYGGGALYAIYSNTTLENVNIARNESTMSGGGIAFRNTTNTQMTLEVDQDTVIEHNKAQSGGGIQLLVYPSNLAPLEAFIHGTVQNNQSLYAVGSSGSSSPAYGAGGIGVYVTRGDNVTLHIKETAKITGNTSAAFGGGIGMYASTSYQKPKLIIEGKVEENEAVSGSGVYAYYTEVFLKANGSVSKNKPNASMSSSAYGAGMYLNNAELSMSGSAMVNENGAGLSRIIYGSGVYGYLSRVAVTEDAQISENAQNAQASVYGGGIYMTGNTSTLSLDGASVNANACGTQGNASVFGGAVYLNGVQATIKHAQLNGNASNSAANFTGQVQGGAINVNNSGNMQVELQDTEICDNAKNVKGLILGGGAYIQGSGSTLRIDGKTRISRNAQDAGNTVSGGGLYMRYALLQMHGGTISDNALRAQSAVKGGGIYMDYLQQESVISGGEVSANAKDAVGEVLGGGVYFVQTQNTPATLKLTGEARIEGNSAKYGGGVYFSYTTSIGATELALEISEDAVIASNHATHDGGGIWAGNTSSYSSKLTVRQLGGILRANQAGENGGGVYIKGYSTSYVNAYTIAAGKILDNTAAGKGAGMYVADFAQLQVADNDVQIENEIYLYSRRYPIQVVKSIQRSGVFPIEVRTTPTSDQYAYKRNDNVVIPFGQDVADASQYIDFFTLKNNEEYILLPGHVDYGNQENIVLGRCVFIDGVGGDDLNTGTTPENAVRTFAVAKQQLANGPGVIFVSGQVIITGNETWTLPSGQNIKRYDGFAIAGKLLFPAYKGDLIIVEQGARLTLGSQNSRLYISGAPQILSDGTMVRVKDGGRLFVENAALSGNRNSGSGGALYIEDGPRPMGGGFVEFAGEYGSIAGCTASRGSAVYQGGTFAILTNAKEITGDIFLAQDRIISVNDRAYHMVSEPLSISLEDAYNHRAIVEHYDSSLSASGQEGRYALASDVAALFSLVVRQGDETILELKQKGCVYINGEGGSDANDGLTPDTAVQTMPRAYKVLHDDVLDGSVIYVVDQVTINHQELILTPKGYTLNGISVYGTPADFENGVYIRRYSRPVNYQTLSGYNAPSNTGNLFLVSASGGASKLTIDGMTLDGHKDAFVSAAETLNAEGVVGEALIRVVIGGELILKGKQLLLCNNIAKNNGGAVAMYSGPVFGGKFWFQEGTIRDVAAQEKGGAIYTIGSVDMLDYPVGGSITTSRTIYNATAGTDGGAIYIDKTGDVNIQANAFIRNNSAAGDGPMIYQGGKLSIKGSISLTGEVFLAENAGAPDGRYIDVIDEFYNNGSWVIRPEIAEDGRAIAKYAVGIPALPNGPNATQISYFPLDPQTTQYYQIGNRDLDKNMLELQIRIAVYIDGVSGDDANDGTSPSASVKTLKRAWDLLLKRQGTMLYVVGTVPIESGEAIELTPSRYTDGAGNRVDLTSTVVVRRYSQPTAHSALTGFDVASNPDELFSVQPGGKLTLNLLVDGHAEELIGNIQVTAPGITAHAPLFAVNTDATLILRSGAVLRANDNRYSQGVTQGLPGGAVHVDSGGELVVQGASITDNTVLETWDYAHSFASQKGSGVYLKGKMVIENEAMTLGTTAKPQTIYLYAEQVGEVAGAFIDISVPVPNTAGKIRVDFPNYLLGRVLAQYHYQTPKPDSFTVDADRLIQTNLTIGKNTNQVLLTKDKFHAEPVVTVWASDEGYPPSDASKSTSILLDLTQMIDNKFYPDNVELSRLVGKTFSVESVKMYGADGSPVGAVNPAWILEDKTTMNSQRSVAGSDFANKHFGITTHINGGAELDMHDEMAKCEGLLQTGTMAVSSNATEAKLTIALHNANALTQTGIVGSLIVVLVSDNDDVIHLTIKIDRIPGQIRATVPLLLVVSTDLQGVEEAVMPDNYGIVSYSDFPLSFDEASVETTAGDPVWTLASADDVRNNLSGTNNISMELNVTDKDDDSAYQDFKKAPLPGRLTYNDVLIEPAEYDKTQTPTISPETLPLYLKIKTSALNFVTYANASDPRAQKGVHAAKITYRLSIPAVTGYEPVQGP